MQLPASYAYNNGYMVIPHLPRLLSIPSDTIKTYADLYKMKHRIYPLKLA
ncbi:hypothetical protein KAW48_02000 [candidate division WOR-3 bacterium]|nr:hypothetical protein [candidate division WOR-3 bacterium]